MHSALSPLPVPWRGPGLLFAWLSGLAFLAVLGWLMILAVRHNPLALDNDRQAHGISKYALIERCREALHHPADLQVGPDMTLGKAMGERLKPGDTFLVKTQASERQWSEALRPLKLQPSPGAPEVAQLSLTLPVMMGLKQAVTGAELPFGQGNFTCAYDSKEKKVVATLGN